ncbi:hypothetical protein CVT26_014506 [Gymnopilus dilepis]|uniref:F-box domain-containing protein n=1 Tax=Gymnopilus dilepis TaxID=231916 RepID=A0A409W397_9AGAR|nr:hypothetical protein CVT26_014506 [Gymnopilus dilepis]
MLRDVRESESLIIHLSKSVTQVSRLTFRPHIHDRLSVERNIENFHPPLQSFKFLRPSIHSLTARFEFAMDTLPFGERFHRRTTRVFADHKHIDASKLFNMALTSSNLDGEGETPSFQAGIIVDHEFLFGCLRQIRVDLSRLQTISKTEQSNSFESETTEGELLGRRDRIEKSPTTCPSSQNDMTELYARIDKIETHLSPIRLLPVDVLRKVFTHFRDRQIVAPSKQCPPLLSISQVCSSWRTITINSPSLWNSITITLTEYSMRRINWGYLLDLWLKRSKDSPLTFEIKDLPDPGGVARDSDNQAFLLALRLLVAHSQRWKDVRLSTSVRVRPNVIAESLNKACNHASFPLLESITFKQLAAVYG